MQRIPPLPAEERNPELLAAFANHVRDYNARITNMKATLGHSLLAFNVYMEWYPLYQQVQKIIGERLAYLYAYSISYASDCPLCSTFFRKIIIDAGEDPENLSLNAEEEKILEFGKAISEKRGHIDNDVYNQVASKHSQQSMIILIAFAGQMIATNIFSNVIQTDIDEYLEGYKSDILLNKNNVHGK